MAFDRYRTIRIQANDDITDRHINAIQDNVSAAINQVLGKDTLDRVLLKNIVILPNVINAIPHGLGRQLTGFSIVRNHGSYSGFITDVQDTNKSPHLTLLLTNPTAITVDIEVF